MLEASWSETYLRLGIFLGVFVMMALWEKISPRRKLSESKLRRWITNLGLIFFNTVIVRVTVGAMVFTVAIFAQENSWGLFNYIETSPWFVIIVSIIVLDFAMYLQHIIFHAFPILWRLHRVHHVDLDFDVTTGLRFHPLEIILSLFYKSIIVIAIGAPPMAVVIFEIILNASSQFNHGNVFIPKRIDRLLRYIIVTPDMHRIHHSSIMDETNSNYGFSLSIWDRMIGTYKKSSKLGQLDMEIGLEEYRDQNKLGILNLITFPFYEKE